VVNWPRRIIDRRDEHTVTDTHPFDLQRSVSSNRRCPARRPQPRLDVYCYAPSSAANSISSVECKAVNTQNAVSMFCFIVCFSDDSNRQAKRLCAILLAGESSEVLGHLVDCCTPVSAVDTYAQQVYNNFLCRVTGCARSGAAGPFRSPVHLRTR